MTEAELVEALTSFMGVSQGSGVQAVGYLFAYIVTTYLVGAKLSRPQAIILTGLFTIVYSASTLAAIAALYKASEYAARLREIRPEDVSFLRIQNIYFSLALFILILLASLYFMWHTRRSRAL